MGMGMAREQDVRWCGDGQDARRDGDGDKAQDGAAALQCSEHAPPGVGQARRA